MGRDGFVLPGLAAVFVCCLLVNLAGCKKSIEPSTKLLTWKTLDGFTQVGTLRKPKGDNPPAILLLHMLNGRRADWEYFADRARDKGYMTLAYDLRGHGDSVARNDQTRTHHGFKGKDWASAVLDIGLAKQRLLEQGADPDNLFIVGASIGANLAVLYATGDSDIQAVILLSPAIEYRNVNIERPIKENRRLPVLLMTAEGDSYSAESARKMKGWSPAYTEMRTYAGTSHGTDLLARSDYILEDIFGWLKPIVEGH